MRRNDLRVSNEMKGGGVYIQRGRVDLRIFVFFCLPYICADTRYAQGAGLVCAMDLTKAALKKMCRDSGLYTSPALNDKLYLHYKVVCSTQYWNEEKRTTWYLT